MRFYENARELMSEMGRDLWEMGLLNNPKTYQDIVIEGNEEMSTKELICKQYCLTKLDDPEYLFAYTNTKEWADAELDERLTTGFNPGKAWTLNYPMWNKFIDPKTGTFSYTYSQRFGERVIYKNHHNISNLEAVIRLLRDDPDTRKAVLSVYRKDIDSNHYEGDARIPCSMYYDFLVRDLGSGPQVNIVYHQRSSDFINHFGDDVYLAWGLMQYVAEELGIKEGYLFHTIDSIHAYKKDWFKLKTSIDDLVHPVL